VVLVVLVDERAELVVQAAHDPSPASTSARAAARGTRIMTLDLSLGSACSGPSFQSPHLCSHQLPVLGREALHSSGAVLATCQSLCGVSYRQARSENGSSTTARGERDQSIDRLHQVE
jgi:hypothetical protein